MRLHTTHLVAATSIALITASTVGAPALAGKNHPRPAPRPAAPSSQPVTIATGLDNPRLLSFDGKALYVAESGRGGTGSCVPSPEGEGAEACLGATGAITKIVTKKTKVRSHRSGHRGRKARRTVWRTAVEQKRVVTGLPSVAVADGSAAAGPSDVVFAGKRWTAAIGLGGTPETRTQLGNGAQLLGTVVTGIVGQKSKGSRKSRGSRATGPTVLADLAAYEAAKNPDGTLVDSNPTSIAADRKGFVAVDAGGNSLLRISTAKASKHGKGRFNDRRTNRRGPSTGPSTVSALTTFPVVNGMDAVPTSAARGPDGAWYVSQLTGFPFPVNGASIFRVVPGKAPTVYATGLTNVTDLAWHRGKLYVVQIADTGLLDQNATGSLRVIKRDKTAKVVVDKLAAPYGVALQGSSAYVTTCAMCAGGGSVVKIALK